MSSFTKKELAILKKLNTPAKVQDFLNKIPFNFEKDGATLRSPLYTLRHRKAHCLEGALLGAYALSFGGHKPYLMLLKASEEDYDHVIAPFKIDGLWGALSKTNHAVLRYREPVYKSLRELAMSYFHEYFLNDGTKTLRAYTELLFLDDFEENWPTLDGDLWGIDQELDKIKHFSILQKTAIRRLRKADRIEIKAGELMEYS
ncbi:MAG: hypothetical protein WD991_01260 [Candidatus Paceibacterota bacterium]